ncbi:MAG: SixA phosphatase family protein [bacterium]|jgi:phosphohistidine phosphatase
MDLILIRHAKAFERDARQWPDDARRPLTEEGVRDFRRLAKQLGRIVPSVELVESSSFDRAWATAELLRRRTGWPKPMRAERLEPDESEGLSSERMQALARSIAAMRRLRTVAWVGHEPMLSALASLLLTGSPRGMRIEFAKGAALALRIDPISTATEISDASSVIGRAELLWMLTPRIVRRMR